MASVTLEGVKKIYDGKVIAVHDFNLQIKDKEFVVFVGPSGCGTQAYTFIWGMCGENQDFDDMDGIKMTDLK